jgi:hypothetical protein
LYFGLTLCSVQFAPLLVNGCNNRFTMQFFAAKQLSELESKGNRAGCACKARMVRLTQPPAVCTRRSLFGGFVLGDNRHPRGDSPEPAYAGRPLRGRGLPRRYAIITVYTRGLCPRPPPKLAIFDNFRGAITFCRPSASLHGNF